MTRPLCVVLDDYQDVALAMADWGPVSSRCELRVLRGFDGGEDQVAAALGDAEIVVAMRERTPFPASLMARLPRLRLLVTTGMANSAIDLDAARGRGVVVCGTESSPTPPTELTWALLLALVRHLPVETGALRSGGPWQQTLGTDLAGRQIGLLGLGKIGSRVARIAQAFDMEVSAWSQHLEPEHAASLGVRAATSLEELVAECDVLSVHLRLSKRSRGLVTAHHLRSMRRTAYLVNTARAEIVDQAALVTALQQGWIAGAGLDVFETEPLPADSPLRTLATVLATPHLGYVTRDNYRRYFGQAVQDVIAYLDGSPMRVIRAVAT